MFDLSTFTVSLNFLLNSLRAPTAPIRPRPSESYPPDENSYYSHVIPRHTPGETLNRPSRGVATTGSRFAEVGRAWKILTPVRGTILFCGRNARYVRERGGSAHRLAVGLWSWGWLGPIIGRGGARAGFWGCGGTLRFEG
ncbi:hypothetical protein QLX08_005441 [Tetragonisca angustula]|uniref:Uncharacterized protein n=1 Tax=Tetragonisca angustula TaxID=166442 RepID=A0AAW0ZXP2_9HYME